jgi:hypothetical protein
MEDSWEIILYLINKRRSKFTYINNLKDTIAKNKQRDFIDIFIEKLMDVQEESLPVI